MADYDSFNYDIESRLPEWWKGFGALEPVNKYTQELIVDILQGLLGVMGVVQPLNCWLTIPEEYNWFHHYQLLDDYLQDENGKKIINNVTTTLFPGNKIHAIVPNTKRNCHAKIQLKLLGTEILKTDDGEIDTDKKPLITNKEIIEELTIENAGQKITLSNIPSISTIEILTETQEILIDGKSPSNLINGEIKKIKPTIKNDNYQTSYIDDNAYKIIKIKENDFDENLIDKNFYVEKINDSDITEIFYEDEENRKEKYLYIKLTNIQEDLEENNYKTYNCIFCKKNGEEYGTGIIDINKSSKNKIKRYKNIDLKDENKKTEIIFHSSKKVNFDLQVYLKKPTYTTEQNIRITTVSAFPIEWVRLFGYFCHPFNNNSGYEFLWEKNYSEESRTVFDRITKQYDCEKFYIQVKFYGIGVPLLKGFPQDIGQSNSTFQLNPNLDKWGKIYGLPRRWYKPNITEEEEPYTFPKYYKYPVEQDYWYEERMVNEYQYNEDPVNALFVKDDEFNNIGVLECIYPFTNNIWVYTETIDPKNDTVYQIKDIPLCSVYEKEGLGESWEKPHHLINEPIHITLKPQSEDIFKENNFAYKTKPLCVSFCLHDAVNEFKEEIPKNIEIKGIELKFKTHMDVQSSKIKLSDESKVIIPFPNPAEENNYILEKIPIYQESDVWLKQKGYYTIGDENNLFSLNKITKEQLFNGNNGKLDFELVFINENNFLQSQLYLENIFLNIYYEVIPTEYSIDVEFDKKEINIKEEDNNEIKMKINIKNIGKVKVYNKEVVIVVPPELKILNEYNSYLFNLDIDEVCDPIEVSIGPFDEIKTGKYDILVICEDKIISNEILIRGGE